MLFSMLSLAFAGLMASVSAQSSSGTYSYTISANDPLASPAQKNSWCLSQTNSCLSICGGSAPKNTCDPTTLTYNCTCGDGSMPDMSQYNSTLLYFECQIYQQDCVKANPTDARAQQSCLAIPCGGKDPMVAAVSTSASATASGSMTTSGSSSSVSETGSSSSAAATTGAAPTLKAASDPYIYMTALLVGLVFLGGLAL